MGQEKTRKPFELTGFGVAWDCLKSRFGTESRNRTGTVSPPPDFESGASTSFAISAIFGYYIEFFTTMPALVIRYLLGVDRLSLKNESGLYLCKHSTPL